MTTSIKKTGDADSDVVIGKDVLELLSSAMYLDPMTIFREYIQNSADAIDEAKAAGALAGKTRGRVHLEIDSVKRSIKITDNGIGVANDIARRRLLSIGASYKRAGKFRGFRGVGRLAGLGYCRELIFRSKAAGDKAVVEFIWDCRTLRSKLRDPGFSGDLSHLINSVVIVNHIPSKDSQDHFFQVELRDITRHRNDALLDVGAIRSYLSQVAPVPFDGKFKYAASIAEKLSPYVDIGALDICINDAAPLSRPISNSFPISDRAEDKFSNIDFFELTAADGKCAAVGWILHHHYIGAIPNRAQIKGLRARCGDIQVGEWNLFEDLFPEPRFNAWTVGEIHIVDRRIVPNGRRDHFEQNIHFNNVQHQIVPLAREIGKKCRGASILRNRVKNFIRNEDLVKQNVKVIASGLLNESQASAMLRASEAALRLMERILDQLSEANDQYDDLSKRLRRLKRKIPTTIPNKVQADLSGIPSHFRQAYKIAYALIYEKCRDPREAAEILRRLHASFANKLNKKVLPKKRAKR
ncbi:ATP-binding protein [Ferrovibrio sp.]|uniref:ATP-binding protein n=1 Tax=Ferrovibrio sp. TaxID=1917215 RepID=UPI00311F983B